MVNSLPMATWARRCCRGWIKEAPPQRLVHTCRIQNPSIPRASLGPAAHGRTAGRGGVEQNGMPTVGLPRNNHPFSPPEHRGQLSWKTPRKHEQTKSNVNLSNPKPGYTAGRGGPGKGGTRRSKGGAERDADGSFRPGNNRPSCPPGHGRQLFERLFGSTNEPNPM